jgi:peptide-methionine (S)-S-oxide reductase
LYDGRYGTNADSAIYNRNYSAAERLVERGAALTLTTALCLNRWEDSDRLMADATLDEKQDAFVQAAMNGNAEAVRRMLALGMNPTTISARNQSHATALHHAVYSSSLDAVRALVEAGAELNRRDTIYDATPLGWAKYCGQQEKGEGSVKKYAEIAAYLCDRGAKD